MQALPALLDLSLLAAAGVAFAAGLMRGFAGVGSGMLMAPIFVLLFGPVQTVVIIVLIETVVTVQLMPGVIRQIDWRVVNTMGVSAVLFMPLGSWLLLSVDTDAMARAIAAIVLVFALVLLTGWRYAGEKNTPASIAVGALSGTMMAATSLGNPPVMLYLLSGRDAAATNRANFTGYFALTLTALILWMTARGQITSAPLTRAALLLPPFMLAAYLGARLFRQSSERLYRHVTLGLLVCVGAFGVLR